MVSGDIVSCGLDFCAVPDLRNSLQMARSARYNFICIPMVHPQLKHEFLDPKMKQRCDPFTRADSILPCPDWTSFVVGKLSPYLNVDVADPILRQNQEETLGQELAYASYLSLPAVMLKLTKNIERNINYARIIYATAKEDISDFQIWAQVPMKNPAKQANAYRSDRGDDIVQSTWEWWNSFGLVCDFHGRLGVALIVSPDIPSAEEIDRWMGEPLKCLILPTTLFIMNKEGYPELSEAHQELLKKFSPLAVQLIVSGTNRHQDITHYYNHLEHHGKSYQKSESLGKLLDRGMGTQIPIQPLSDNVTSVGYEAFEDDIYKYKQYQNAIHQIILDKVPEAEKDSRTVVIMVVGGGRGPLVRAAFNAADNAGRKVRMYVVEKNPNAVVTLRALQKEIWGSRLTVVSSDMRKWAAPEKADILVSELLGSFGDNEASPECLDIAQQFLKDDGVNVPYSYTSWINPVHSSKLYNEVKRSRLGDKDPSVRFEMMYNFHHQNKYDIAKPQPLFTFIHPNRDPVINNNRYAVKKFIAKQNSVLHGFAGYFDAVLYKDVTVSIVPETHSPDMISWFPMFIPIKQTVLLKAGDEIEVHFWRRCNPKNLWYEWCISKPVPGSIHNPNGSFYKIGL